MELTYTLYRAKKTRKIVEQKQVLAIFLGLDVGEDRIGWRQVNASHGSV
jgi:hypothetical protein